MYVFVLHDGKEDDDDTRLVFGVRDTHRFVILG